MPTPSNPDPTSSTPSPSCPVDPAARSKWSSLFSLGSSPHPASTPSNPTTAEESCPTARAKWLSQSTLSTPPPSGSAAPGKSCDSGTLAASTATTTTSPLLQTHPSLGQHREISSIPRASLEGSNSEHSPTPVPAPASDSPRKDLGNWIYPSEAMFFAAMQRKFFSPVASDMRTIVPLHNAVNERVWAEIKDWEEGWGGESCGGPRLASFSGDSTKLTPRARMKTWLGYHPPFDRHDWTVDRCGKKVEYVIDFYAGKTDPKAPEKLSFYLDVRPKISVEGVKMRVGKWVGGWF